MEFIELLTVTVGIIFASKIVAQFTKTVDILWYIIFGLIGTQYLFHVDLTQLENWSTLGVIFIMFYAGWRENLLTFAKEIWNNKWVALIAAAGPFLGAWLAYTIFGFNGHEAVIAGFIFTATAVPYTIAVLTNLGLEKTRAAKSALASAMADNFISIFLAVGVLPAYALFKSGHEVNGFGEIMTAVAQQIGLVGGAFLLFALLGLIILPDAHKHIEINVPHAMQRDGFLARISHFIYRIRRAPGLYELSKKFFNMRIGIPMTLLLLFGLSWLAHEMGLHPAIGAYLTGLILHVEMYHEEEIDDITGEKVAVNHKNLSVFFYFAQEWIGPMFFIFLGSQLVADWSKAWVVALSGLGMAIIIGSFQFVTAYYGGRKTAKLPKHDSVLLGIGMLPRDVLAFVVLGIAVSTGLVNQDDPFVITVVLTVLSLNIMSSIGMNWYKKKYEKAEEQRLLEIKKEA